MTKEPEPLDLSELSDRANVSVRTIRYYIQSGLLPAPDSRGPGARYGSEHLDRLRVIRRLQREHLPLAEIRRQLELMTPEEIGRMAKETTERRRTSARDYIRGVLGEPDAMVAAEAPAMLRDPHSSGPHAQPDRSHWDRITLAPDVELHVRRPLSREQNRQIERLLRAARDILEEDVS